MVRALVFEGPEKMSIQEVPVPSISEKEILVKVKFAGVCGTDIRIYGGTKVINSPRITGHEFAGEIVEIGHQVDGFKVGDRVTVYPMLACGTCYACQSKRSNICVNRTTIGYEIDGGFAEYVRIPFEAIEGGNVLRIPDNVSYEKAAIAEPLAAALNGIQRAQLQEGQSLAIVGAGPIGLGHVLLAKTKGVKILLIEPKKEKRDLALKLGADYVLDPGLGDVKKEVMLLTNGAGVDSLLLDVGIPKVIEESLELVKKGGRFILFAGCPVGSRITIDPNLIHYKEIEFTGASSSTPDNEAEILALISEGKIDVEQLITDVLPFSQWLDAFNLKKNYQGLKTILNLESQ